MLSMSNVSSVGAASSYYAADNYYSTDENLARSAWAGKGAEELGLRESVDPKVFTEILSGEVGGQQLGRVVGLNEDGTPKLEHRPGYDMTLSAPKSVSILAEVGEQRDVRAAHEAAVTAVINYAEANLVGARVSENGVIQFVQTDNLVAARFHHNTSRSLDPQTHTHVVIANATRTDDGIWRSLSNEQLYKAQALLGAIYDSELRNNLVKLGYKLEMGDGGKWEIAGISREQIEHFSQRSQDIEARLERFGLTRETATAAQREDAALRTRDAKREVDHAELLADWKSRAAQVGLNIDQIVAGKTPVANVEQSDKARLEAAADSVRFAIEHLTERQSVVSPHEVSGVALNHAASKYMGREFAVTQKDVEGALVAAREGREVIQTPDGRLTTLQAVSREKEMLKLLTAGREAVTPIMDGERVERGIHAFEAQKSLETGSNFQLKEGQVSAAKLSLTTSDRVIGVQGYAGAGKTTMMELVKTLAADAGYTVKGMAPSAEAARVLEAEAGIKSVTTARFLLDVKQLERDAVKPKWMEVVASIDLKGTDFRRLQMPVPQGLPSAKNEVWVLDEASLASQREITELMRAAEKLEARLILVGDVKQLNAVEAGKPFEVLQNNGMKTSELLEISRQQRADMIASVQQSIAGKNPEALATLSDRVVQVSNRDGLLDRIASDLLEKDQAGRSNTLVIAPLTADRNALNERVREGLISKGELSSESIRTMALVPTGFTDAAKREASQLENGMVVRFAREYRTVGVEKGEYATVTAIDRKTGDVTLRTESGRTVQWSPEKHTKVEVYTPVERNIAVGEEIRFTRNDKSLGINNGTFGKVTGINDGKITVSTDRGVITLDSNRLEHAHRDYAYAMTVYASQGKTVDDTRLLITSGSGQAMGERSFYVGITRARTDLTIYTDDKAKAVNLVSRMQEKHSALEALGHKPKPIDDHRVKSSGGRGNSAEL